MNLYLRLTLVFLAVLLIATPSIAQDNQPIVDHKPDWFLDTDALVVIPEDRQLIAAYSFLNNTWSRLQLESPLSIGIMPKLSGGMVAVRSGLAVHGYSAKIGEWDSLTLSSKDSAVAMETNCMTVTDNNILFVFGENAGQWSGINLKSGALVEHK